MIRIIIWKSEFVRFCALQEPFLVCECVDCDMQETLQSEGESVQQRWMMAQNMEESVAAVVNMDVRAGLLL